MRNCVSPTSTIFNDSSLMVICSDWEDLKAIYSIATLRYGRFMDSLKGLYPRGRDEEEAIRLEEQMREVERAWMRHEAEHGCRVDGFCP